MFFLVFKVFHRGSCEPHSKSNWTHGSIASFGGSVPVFLGGPKATCDFPGVGGSEPPPFSGSTHALCPFYFFYLTEEGTWFFDFNCLVKFCVFVCVCLVRFFMSTAMVKSRQPVYLTILFPRQA